MSRLVTFRFGHTIKPLRRSKSALLGAALLTLLVFIPMSALAQVHRSIPALTLSKAFSRGRSRRLQVW